MSIWFQCILQLVRHGSPPNPFEIQPNQNVAKFICTLYNIIKWIWLSPRAFLSNCVDRYASFAKITKPSKKLERTLYGLQLRCASKSDGIVFGLLCLDHNKHSLENSLIHLFHFVLRTRQQIGVGNRRKHFTPCCGFVSLSLPDMTSNVCSILGTWFGNIRDLPIMHYMIFI